MQLNLYGAYDNELWMVRSGGRLLLAQTHSGIQCGHNDFKTVTLNRCPELIIIADIEEKAAVFAYPGSQLYLFYIAAKKRALTKMLQLQQTINVEINLFVRHGPLLHAWAGLERSSRLGRHTHFFCFIYLFNFFL